MGSTINHVVGTAPVTLRNPGNAQLLVLAADVGSWRLRLGDLGQRDFAAADVDITADEITINGHGYSTGDGPVRMTTDTTLPAGITATQDLFVIVVNDSTIQVAKTKSNALNGTQIDITSQGTGNHALDGMFANAEDPTASLSDGAGAVKLGAGTSLVIPAPAEISVKGFGTTPALAYFFI